MFVGAIHYSSVINNFLFVALHNVDNFADYQDYIALA